MAEHNTTDSGDDQQHNPYAVGETQTALLSSRTPEEKLRHQYIKHEAALQSLGVFYLIAAVCAGMWAATGIWAALSIVDPVPRSAALSPYLALLAVAVLHGLGGIQLWRLKRSARAAGLVIAVLGLLLFPCGTLLGPYAMYLLLSHKASVVLSDSYHSAVVVTPHITPTKFRTSATVLGVALLIVIGGILLAGVFS